MREWKALRWPGLAEVQANGTEVSRPQTACHLLSLLGLERKATCPSEEQRSCPTLSSCLPPFPSPSNVWPNPGIRTMTNPDFFSLFFVVLCHFNALSLCIPNVFRVHLSSVPLVGCSLCLVPPLPAGSPGVWMDSIQCQTAGPEAEWQLPTLSSPQAPICLPLWWVPLLLHLRTSVPSL